MQCSKLYRGVILDSFPKLKYCLLVFVLRIVCEFHKLCMTDISIKGRKQNHIPLSERLKFGRKDGRSKETLNACFANGAVIIYSAFRAYITTCNN